MNNERYIEDPWVWSEQREFEILLGLSRNNQDTKTGR